MIAEQAPVATATTPAASFDRREGVHAGRIETGIADNFGTTMPSGTHATMTDTMPTLAFETRDLHGMALARCAGCHAYRRGSDYLAERSCVVIAMEDATTMC